MYTFVFFALYHEIIFLNINSLGMYCVIKCIHMYVLASTVGYSQRQFKSTSVSMDRAVPLHS